MRPPKLAGDRDEQLFVATVCLSKWLSEKQVWMLHSVLKQELCVWFLLYRWMRGPNSGLIRAKNAISFNPSTYCTYTVCS
jgi:hypothetical protein